MKNLGRTIYFRKNWVIAFAAISLLLISATSPYHYKSRPNDAVPQPINLRLSYYSELHLKDLGLSQKAYQLALKGWEKLKEKGRISKEIISICDFTQPSNNKRLYVIDLATGTLLFNTLVAHGKNTGTNYARYFSNKPSSLQSSLAIFITGEAYNGGHGLALALDGLEPGFNDKARERAIVMHGADYVSGKFISQYGTLGRSWGCPAVPSELHEEIINTIKGGSCLFIYYPDKKYISASRLVN